MAGYAVDVEPKKVERFPGDPGTKRNTWEGLSGWYGIDEWRTTDLGEGSNGVTSIYYRGHLIWEMQYGGQYPNRVIPFLRKMLERNYTQGIWLGGRGPAAYKEGVFSYENRVEKNNFADFCGKETVYEIYPNGGDHAIGHHYYRGGFVMNDPDR